MTRRGEWWCRECNVDWSDCDCPPTSARPVNACGKRTMKKAHEKLTRAERARRKKIAKEQRELCSATALLEYRLRRAELYVTAAKVTAATKEIGFEVERWDQKFPC